MNQKRIFELDVLRGFAVLLVMGVHVPAHSIDDAVTLGYPLWTRSGWLGVDLFFVLSGFLISNLLFTEYRKSGAIRLPRFFFRRAMKLYPSFYLMLAVTLLCFALFRVPFSARQVFGEAILTQNYIGALWGHTWSLAVEEHFYLFLPVALASMMRWQRGHANPFRAVPYLFGAIALICLLLRVWTYAAHPNYDHHIHGAPSHLRFDSLFAGVFLSYLRNFSPHILEKAMSRPWRFPVSLLGIVCLSPALFLDKANPVEFTAGYTLNYVAFGTMLLLALYKDKQWRPKPPGTALRQVARMGEYSYTIYLWNVPTAIAFSAIASRYESVSPYAFHPFYFATSIFLGVALSKLVERPVLALRERLSLAMDQRRAAEAPVVNQHSQAGNVEVLTGRA